jgi:hypothetical protein
MQLYIPDFLDKSNTYSRYNRRTTVARRLNFRKLKNHKRAPIPYASRITNRTGLSRGNALDLYSVGNLFESRPGYLLS